MLRVLVVDDCKDGADTLALLLRLWGHKAKVAYDGFTALRLAQAFRPDVLLMDINLPEMDGYCLARKFRERDEFQHTLLIAITGYTDLTHRAQGVEAGFDSYLVKPVDPTVLQEMLGRWASFPWEEARRTSASGLTLAQDGL
jgi:CheY-like chemotaxis protein